MLAQFGRTIFDALVAWNSLCRESHEDNYAQQLEPELGRWPLIFNQAFSTWRSAFMAGDSTFRLPISILKRTSRSSKTRMAQSAAIQAFNFSQAEILRAYAVQLHLKQIARLLRSSRVETSRAIGEAQMSEALATETCAGLPRNPRFP